MLSCCRPPMSEGHPISMVCSRSGVRLYAATPSSGPGLLRAAARFVSAMYGTVWVLSRICRPQEEPLSAGRVRVHTCCECYSKRGYIRTWYVYKIFLFIFRLMRYTDVCFFSLTGVLFHAKPYLCWCWCCCYCTTYCWLVLLGAFSFSSNSLAKAT